MEILDHQTCLLRNLYAGQEARVKTGHGPTDWFQIGKGVRQGCILSPCLFNLYAEYIMRNTRLEEALAGIMIQFSSVQFSSVAQSSPTLCDSMNCSTPGLPVHHQLPELTQTHVPWTARRSNQSILKEISPGCSLEGMMLKLKLQYFATSCEESTHWK